MYTPAEFMSDVEEKTAVENIPLGGRKILLQDMSDIISKINENPDPACQPLKILNFGFAIRLSSRNYERSYNLTGTDSSYIIKDEHWYDKGLHHRGNDKPASILYDTHNSGHLEREEYWVEGKLHRDGEKPALVEYGNKNNPLTETWYQRGVPKRDGDKPARIWYYPDGNVESEVWYINGIRGRSGSRSSRINYDEKGRVIANDNSS